ncbi:Late embryogenesis abundant protein [Lutibacter oricola]|uniref:Late embryogenesis abundant protein n=1 Tax=Lutibacter oricola TaxID=762486 RepID=A0A1H2YX35_9FLAO|nr:LEA type 2 family protein [Lutibacter oricola]SDX09760.1 Late embryogenesis abundant protein [Lutibacter oricola]
MKRLLLFVLVCSLVSCSVRETPEFVTVKNIKVLKSDKKNLTLKGDALFKNPNIIGGKLQADGIKVLVNGNEVAEVSSEVFNVPSEKEFTIPLLVDIPVNKVFTDKNLGSLLGSILTKKMEVKYIGKINYKILGFSHSYTVDETETVKIKL